MVDEKVDGGLRRGNGGRLLLPRWNGDVGFRSLSFFSAIFLEGENSLRVTTELRNATPYPLVNI